MFFKLFILFAIMPIVEISLLLHVGDIIGGWNTLAIVIITAFIGATLVRQQGTQTFVQAQHKMHQGQLPGQELAEGLLLLIAGVLLVTPGFITDIIGLLFTLPVTRPIIASYLVKNFFNKMTVNANQSFTYTYHSEHHRSNSQSQEDIIEGEFRRTDNPSLKDVKDDKEQH